jgi:hypothetical protein
MARARVQHVFGTCPMFKTHSKYMLDKCPSVSVFDMWVHTQRPWGTCPVTEL